MGYRGGHRLPEAASQGNGADSVVGIAFVLAFATVGLLLAWKRPANPIGWLLAGTALCYAAGGFGLFLGRVTGHPVLADWTGWVWLAGLALTEFVLLLFPAGSLVARRWRAAAWAAGAGLACWVLGNAFAPVIITSGPPAIQNPIGVPGPAGRIFEVLAAAGGGLIALGGAAAVVSLIVRYRRAGSVQREQLRWLLYAAGLIGVAVLANLAIGYFVRAPQTASNLENAVVSAAIVAVPLAIGTAVFRYRLYDIDLVISKTLIVAVAFHPVAERVRRAANWLVFGKRATP